MVLGAVGGPVAWQTPGFDHARDRYHLTIEGGAAGAAVSTVLMTAFAYRDVVMPPSLVAG
jgi:hypothetical protein